jgi:hypothetical protein
MATIYVKRFTDSKDLGVIESTTLNKNKRYEGTGVLSRVVTKVGSDYVTVKPVFAFQFYGKKIVDLPEGTQPIGAYTSVAVEEENPTA